MRMQATFFVTFIAIQSLTAQNSFQTEVIQLEYTNGFEVFEVCVKNPMLVYDEKKEYFWYTEFSQIKSTKGGAGGKLLNGNYKFYNEDGSLIIDGNYYLGLKDGTFKSWDSVGNIIETKVYEKDKIKYHKFLNDEGLWVEHKGDVFGKGWEKRVYTWRGIMVEEVMGLDAFNYHVKSFYNSTGKLKADYYVNFERCYGKYSSFYENGTPEFEGAYLEDSPIEIRIGTWKWFNPDGTLQTVEEYKAEIEKWNNGKFKSVGESIYDESKNEWVRSGHWMWFNESGSRIDSKEYKMGKEMIK